MVANVKKLQFMKLLVLTQKIDKDDPILGFFLGWVREFAKYCEQVTVICLWRGEYELPANVRVFSLGKEKIAVSCQLLAVRLFVRLKYLYNFYKYIWKFRREYDSVFVHMNQVYAILGAPFWRLLGKRVGLWYAHGKVTLSLKLAERLTQLIFTSTSEGCRLKSKKIRVIGQGIDVEKFKAQSPTSKVQENVFKLITVGRISPSKDLDTMISAVKELKSKNITVRLKIIGGAGAPNEAKHVDELKARVQAENLAAEVKFLGPLANSQILSHLLDADLFLNSSHTGSLDKAVLEAMAAGLPVITSNEAVIEVLKDYRGRLTFDKGDYLDLAEKIKILCDLPTSEREKIGNELRQIVIRDHGLVSFVGKIMDIYAKTA